MPRNNKPTIEYDFGRADLRMAEELPRRTVIELENRGLPTNKLQAELRAYLKAKPVGTTRPRQLMQIITRYVNVQPTNFRDMTLVLGVEAARRMIPDGDFIPKIVWDAQDYLDHLDPFWGDHYRRDLDEMINTRTGAPREYYRVMNHWLSQAVVTLDDVRRFRDARRTEQSNRAVPA